MKDEEDFAQMMVSAGTTSKLDPAIQSLVRMIFDVDSMKQTLLEFEVDSSACFCCSCFILVIQIDVNKMPLGKLSKKQIENAYKVLTEALTEMQGDKNPTKLLDASNRFYTLIPHDFGLQSPPLLDNEEIIKVLLCAHAHTRTHTRAHTHTHTRTNIHTYNMLYYCVCSQRLKCWIIYWR